LPEFCRAIKCYLQQITDGALYLCFFIKMRFLWRRISSLRQAPMRQALRHADEWSHQREKKQNYSGPIRLHYQALARF